MKLNRSEQVTYKQCLGKCHTCLLEGGCALEDKLKKSATEKVTCKSCNKGHAIIGDCATKCSHCNASLDPNTGEPYMSDGKVVHTAQLGGCNYP